MVPNKVGCFKWWVMSDENWVMNDGWWKLSDKWWVMKTEWWVTIFLKPNKALMVTCPLYHTTNVVGVRSWAPYIKTNSYMSIVSEDEKWFSLKTTCLWFYFIFLLKTLESSFSFWLKKKKDFVVRVYNFALTVQIYIG